MAIQVSENFTLEELYASPTAVAKGIDNRPGTTEIVNLVCLCHHVLQPLRTAMNQPIKLSSGYRCKRLNMVVGGVINSQHTRGQAADIHIDGDMAKGKRWFEWIIAHCDFDQIIWEHNKFGTYWIHVSYRNDGRNRKNVIRDMLKK